MPASKPESASPVENPSVLIRSRIKEGRIFEARFLCRQLSADLDAKEKNALIRELAQLQARVEKLQQQARACVAMEEYTLAGKLYQDIELIAIDVPGLAEEKKALEGAEALVAKIVGKTVTQEPVIIPQRPAPVESEKMVQPLAVTRYRLKRWPRPWLLFCLLGLGLLVLLLFSLRRHLEEKPLATTLKPSQTQPTQQIFIKPLASISSSGTIDQPDKKAEDNDPPAGTALPPSTSVQVGALQIKESVRE